MYDEVFKRQEQLIKDKENERKQKEETELKARKVKQQEIMQAEKQKKAVAERREREYEEELLKFQKSCNLKEITDLSKYNTHLEEVQKELLDKIEENEKANAIKVARVAELKAQLKGMYGSVGVEGAAGQIDII